MGKRRNEEIVAVSVCAAADRIAGSCPDLGQKAPP